jgi:hypothetical protein
VVGEIWPQVGQLGGVVVLVAFMARWVWGIERDMIRRYASRTADLEKRNAELEGELDRLRRAYWDLYRARGKP